MRKRNAALAVAFVAVLAVLASAEWSGRGNDGDALWRVATEAEAANRLRERQVKALERIAGVLERMEARTPQPAERPGR